MSLYINLINLYIAQGYSKYFGLEGMLLKANSIGFWESLFIGMVTITFGSIISYQLYTSKKI